MPKVIAGSLRGRSIRTPRGLRTRPTSSRVREAIFDVLHHHPTHGQELPGSRVLDLFAGSGALGIEALSRGAAAAVFVEQSRRACQALRQSLRELELGDRTRVFETEARRAIDSLARQEDRFQLVFLDPPYNETHETRETIARLLESGIVEHGGLIVLEQRQGTAHPTTAPPTPPLRRSWGDTEVLFYRHEQL